MNNWVSFAATHLWSFSQKSLYNNSLTIHIYRLFSLQLKGTSISGMDFNKFTAWQRYGLQSQPRLKVLQFQTPTSLPRGAGKQGQQFMSTSVDNSSDDTSEAVCAENNWIIIWLTFRNLIKLHELWMCYIKIQSTYNKSLNMSSLKMCCNPSIMFQFQLQYTNFQTNFFYPFAFYLHPLLILAEVPVCAKKLGSVKLISQSRMGPPWAYSKSLTPLPWEAAETSLHFPSAIHCYGSI